METQIYFDFKNNKLSLKGVMPDINYLSIMSLPMLTAR